MKEDRNLTKYLYMEDIRNIKKLQSMSLEERKEFYIKNENINRNVVYNDKQDEMFSLIDIYTHRDSAGNILGYFDCETSSVVGKVSEDKLNEIKNIPCFRRNIDLFRKYYYNPRTGILFSHDDNILYVHDMNCVNQHYIEYNIQFPPLLTYNDMDSPSYMQERQSVKIYYSDATKENKIDFELKAYLSYHNLDDFTYDNNGDIRITNIDCPTIDGKKYEFSFKRLGNVCLFGNVQYDNLDHAMADMKYALTQFYSCLNSDSIEKVIKPLIDMMDKYYTKDFDKEKTHELFFVGGQNFIKY